MLLADDHMARLMCWVSKGKNINKLWAPVDPDSSHFRTITVQKTWPRVCSDTML